MNPGVVVMTVGLSTTEPSTAAIESANADQKRAFVRQRKEEELLKDKEERPRHVNSEQGDSVRQFSDDDEDDNSRTEDVDDDSAPMGPLAQKAITNTLDDHSKSDYRTTSVEQDRKRKIEMIRYGLDDDDDDNDNDIDSVKSSSDLTPPTKLPKEEEMTQLDEVWEDLQPESHDLNQLSTTISNSSPQKNMVQNEDEYTTKQNESKQKGAKPNVSCRNARRKRPVGTRPVPRAAMDSTKPQQEDLEHALQSEVLPQKRALEEIDNNINNNHETAPLAKAPKQTISADALETKDLLQQPTSHFDLTKQQQQHKQQNHMSPHFRSDQNLIDNNKRRTRPLETKIVPPATTSSTNERKEPLERAHGLNHSNGVSSSSGAEMEASVKTVKPPRPDSPIEDDMPVEDSEVAAIEGQRYELSRIAIGSMVQRTRCEVVYNDQDRRITLVFQRLPGKARTAPIMEIIPIHLTESSVACGASYLSDNDNAPSFLSLGIIPESDEKLAEFRSYDPESTASRKKYIVLEFDDWTGLAHLTTYLKERFKDRITDIKSPEDILEYSKVLLNPDNIPEFSEAESSPIKDDSQVEASEVGAIKGTRFELSRIAIGSVVQATGCEVVYHERDRKITLIFQRLPGKTISDVRDAPEMEIIPIALTESSVVCGASYLGNENGILSFLSLCILPEPDEKLAKFRSYKPGSTESSKKYIVLEFKEWEGLAHVVTDLKDELTFKDRIRDLEFPEDALEYSEALIIHEESQTSSNNDPRNRYKRREDELRLVYPVVEANSMIDAKAFYSSWKMLIVGLPGAAVTVVLLAVLVAAFLKSLLI